MANRRKQDLDIPRHHAVDLGQSAVKAARAGYDIEPAGAKVDWSGAVQSACMGKRSITTEYVERQIQQPKRKAEQGSQQIQGEVLELDQQYHAVGVCRRPLKAQ